MCIADASIQLTGLGQYGQDGAAREPLTARAAALRSGAQGQPLSFAGALAAALERAAAGGAPPAGNRPADPAPFPYEPAIRLICLNRYAPPGYALVVRPACAGLPDLACGEQAFPGTVRPINRAA